MNYKWINLFLFCYLDVHVQWLNRFMKNRLLFLLMITAFLKGTSMAKMISKKRLIRE
jgi:hypothetical protein